jgi:O-antigen/teichoic acid export membrane protein
MSVQRSENLMSYVFANLSKVFNDSLYRNSLFLILSRLLNVISGFFFWVVAAKLYPLKDVGQGTALISSLGLIILFSSVGLDLTLVRFILIWDKEKVFNTSLVLTTISTAAISILYYVIQSLFQINLLANLAHGLLFMLIAIFNSIALITGNMFCALKKGQYYFIQILIQSSRLLLLFLLVNFAGFGIFLALGICYLLSSFFSLWLISKEVKINFLKIDLEFIKESCKFSLGTFLSHLLIEAPTLLLPIMILHLLGQEQAAKYYIAMNIGNLALIVPHALSFSLFIEGSHGQPLKENIIKSCSTSYLLLIPIVIIIGLGGKHILGFINKAYIEAYFLLLLVVSASLFAVIHMLFLAVQNITMQVKNNIILNLLRFIILLGTSYLFMHKYNINGVGYAWLLTHIILALIVGAKLRKLFIKDYSQIYLTLTTGPIVKDALAKSLVILVSNTTCETITVNIVVKDLSLPDQQFANIRVNIEGFQAKAEILPDPPTMYEVIMEEVKAGIFFWTSTRINFATGPLTASKFIASNTVRHSEFITL